MKWFNLICDELSGFCIKTKLNEAALLYGYYMWFYVTDSLVQQLIFSSYRLLIAFIFIFTAVQTHLCP